MCKNENKKENEDQKETTEQKKENIEELNEKEIQVEKEENENDKDDEMDNSEDNIEEKTISDDDLIEQLQQENETLEEERDFFQKKYQRLKADFSNFRKRNIKEKEGISLQAQIELLEELITVIDNLERALLSAEDGNGGLKKGVKLIYKQFLNVLKQKGLEVIESEGKPFNHKYHEAIMQVEDSEYESGMIVEVMQKGYLFNGRVIRPAMVKVAQ